MSRSELQRLSNNFNNTVKTLVTKLEKKSRDEVEIANLDRLKRRISLVCKESGSHIIIKESVPIFKEFAGLILEEDKTKLDNNFLTFDFRAEFIRRKGAIEKSDEFLFQLIDSIRKRYAQSSRDEKDELYNHVRNLFDDSMEYALNVCKISMETLDSN